MGVSGALWSPYLLEPNDEQIAFYANRRGVDEATAFADLHKIRNDIIRRETNDPLRSGWESPIWGLCDCLLGVPWVDKARAEAMRKLLGFDNRVRVLLLLGGNRCLGSNTLIYDPVKMAYTKVSEITSDFHVEAKHCLGHIITTKAERPFVKSVEDIYEVSLANGEVFEATLSHQVLCEDGKYRMLSEILVASFPILLASNSDISPPTRIEDGLSFLNRVRGFLCGCLKYFRFYDVRPPLAKVFFPCVPPSQADVPKHNCIPYCAYHSNPFFVPSLKRNCDDRAYKSSHNRPYLSLVPLSTQDDFLHNEGRSLRDEAVDISLSHFPLLSLLVGMKSLSRFVSRQVTNLCGYLRAFLGLCLSRILSSLSPCLDTIVPTATTITTIKHLRQDKVWDFNVPIYHNYVCSGIVHHNSSKTVYGLRTMCRLQWEDQLVKQWNGVRTWSFHMTHQQSVEYHHAIMWNYLPPELRIKQITSKVNISYGQKDGFTRDKYVLPNSSEHSFRNYSQNRSDAIEGGEPNGFYADELVPGDWIETMDMRLATRDGYGIIGFTPVDGYNSTVRLFCDGAKTVKKSTAYLLPKDNKPPLEHLALGLNEREYAEIIAASEAGRKPECVSCRPEDPATWLNGDIVGDVKGRVFENVPRVLKCNNGRWGVVYFHSSDNPFGNPGMVVSNIRDKSVAFRRERFYGVAEKAISGKFPLFEEKVHVVEKVPDAGTNYLFVDPSSARPFFMLWIKATPEGVYVYREWPSADPIPGLGALGVWAEPSGNITDYDGKKGPAQKNIGWGFLRYKEEIARLEKWTAYEAGKPADLSYEDWIIGMSDRGPSVDKVWERYMDARFGNVKGFEDGGMKTLLESFDEVNLNFFETTSKDGTDSIDTGCNMINDALFYNQSEPVSFLNKPKLFVHSSCQNTIFALQVYTGLDGATGACKDPIDCLRYFYKKNCSYIESNKFSGIAGRGIY